MNNRAPKLGLVLAATLALSSCQSKPAPSSAVAPAAVKAAAPPAPPVSEDRAYIASGPLVVENQVDVAAQREGVVARTQAEPGATVRKGQLLATLDDRQLVSDREAAIAKMRATEANMKNWEAEVKVLQADLERAEKMWEAQLITKQDLEHARFKVIADQYEVQRERENLRNAEATLRSLELELEKTRITAPFDGVVARRYVRVGQKVAVGDRLFWVSAVAPLRVRFNLPESFLGRVKIGEQVSVMPAALPEEKYAARILQVSPVVDPASATIEVLAEVIGPAGELRPGMTATIRVEPPR